MASINKAILIGNAGKDPEVRYLPSGKAAASISIATTSKRKGQDGQYIEETQWHRVQFFDRLAEIVGEYVKKGSSIYVEGRIKYGKYTDKDGVERNTCDIIATEMTLLGSKQQGEQRPSSQDAPRSASAPVKQAAKQAGGSGFEDMDDIIPF